MSDLSELYARNPLKLSDQDIDEIIAENRKYLAQYNAGDKKPAKTAAKKAPTGGPITLESLGLGGKK